MAPVDFLGIAGDIHVMTVQELARPYPCRLFYPKGTGELFSLLNVSVTHKRFISNLARCETAKILGIVVCDMRLSR